MGQQQKELRQEGRMEWERGRDRMKIRKETSTMHYFIENHLFHSSLRRVHLAIALKFIGCVDHVRIEDDVSSYLEKQTYARESVSSHQHHIQYTRSSYSSFID